MSANVAAIHLITASAQIGSPVLAASILIFGGAKAREDFVVEDWEFHLKHGEHDDFSDTHRNHIEFLLASGAKLIPADVISSRVVGCQTRHQCVGTIWQNHYQSHVSHYAYLFALTSQKRDVMIKGFNMDGFCLNAANRFISETDKTYPTGASSPEAGLFYLKELYIASKRFLGHDMDSDGAKILKENAPKLAKVTTPSLPTMPAPKTPPSLPGAPSTPAMPKLPTNILTAPALPPTLPALPGQ